MMIGGTSTMSALAHHARSAVMAQGPATQLKGAAEISKTHAKVAMA